ncbi:unnamed protein product [Cyprideis torosa]|uniref:Catalase n=1 Tax=Cyprideis torosa TaxID=163714 RepID=A0A7R8ZM29_9CRUS|nr:unnamed protein product [Cyprideis torosa]CAG0883435.1 unnamed protein product [Cyprideis torosa]
MMGDKATVQLVEWKNQKGPKASERLATGFGAPVDDKLNALTAGERGPQLMQDIVYLDEMAHFDRERIPERVVHAKGGGAFGYFEVTHDITRYCKAKIFSEVGKQTPLAIRFSTVGGESGSADTVRDPRGFAVKFYTEDGNWDLVGNNTPIFFIRDPLLFPSFIHTQKRNPVTHLKDPNMFWDFISLRPETTHQVCFLFADRGIPDGFRRMHGWGSHTFKLVNAEGEPVYCKFRHVCDQGVQNLDPELANELAGSDPDYSLRDLYNAIAEGSYPTWTTTIQVMTFEQAEQVSFNPFDLTKVWPHADFPEIPVGKIVLNRNPSNYFAEIEQLAFCPSHMVPGIEPSPDKMLQGRLFSYDDTQRHRLGANNLQIPVNCPYRVRVANYQRDGPMTTTDNQAGAPNYYPNSFMGPLDDISLAQSRFPVSGDVARFDTANDDNFSQVTVFWENVLDEAARQRLVNNIAGHLVNAEVFIQERAVGNFAQVHPDFGQMLTEALGQLRKTKRGMAANMKKSNL